LADCRLQSASMARKSIAPPGHRGRASRLRVFGRERRSIVAMTARFCDFINAHSSAADPISVEQETSGHGACVRFGAPAPLALDELAKEAGNYGDPPWFAGEKTGRPLPHRRHGEISDRLRQRRDALRLRSRPLGLGGNSCDGKASRTAGRRQRSAASTTPSLLPISLTDGSTKSVNPVQPDLIEHPLRDLAADPRPPGTARIGGRGPIGSTGARKDFGALTAGPADADLSFHSSGIDSGVHNPVFGSGLSASSGTPFDASKPSARSPARLVDDGAVSTWKVASASSAKRLAGELRRVPCLRARTALLRRCPVRGCADRPDHHQIEIAQEDDRLYYFHLRAQAIHETSAIAANPMSRALAGT
jgi:hypothetical protein